MTEMVEVPDIGQTHVPSLVRHPFAHFKRGSVRKRRAQHACGIDTAPSGGNDAAGEHLGLPRPWRREHEMAPRRERHNLSLVFSEPHGVSGFQDRALCLGR